MEKKSDNGYFNYYAALGLRARAYLYNGQYAEALADAKEVIGEGGFKMLNRDNYVEAWTKEKADETILEFMQTDKYNQQRYAPGYYCDADGYSENAFNEEGYLYKYLVANKDKDIRAGLIKDQSAASYKKAAGFYPNKYPGRNGNLYVNNTKLLRLSEMYLIAAEHSGILTTLVHTIWQRQVPKQLSISMLSTRTVLPVIQIRLLLHLQTFFMNMKSRCSARTRLHSLTGVIVRV